MVNFYGFEGCGARGILCLYYSRDYCRLFYHAKMLNGAEATFSTPKSGAETCLTVTIR
jgi:hypothetical protein